MTAKVCEANFDGIVGPTYHYGGLSYGNIASQRHKGYLASPKRAALQGLKKMKLLADLGVKQAVVPPQERPDLGTLRLLGFHGSDEKILQFAFRQDAQLLSACSSASSCWAANAATVSPSGDTLDHRIHFTPANLVNQFHRSLETETTARFLKIVFNHEEHFVHHSPLPATNQLSDEGAANHTRLCKSYNDVGIECFTYGAKVFNSTQAVPIKYPARQKCEASQAIARQHQLPPDRVIFMPQNPKAIDAGVFHNDVVALGNKNVFLYHTFAFSEPKKTLSELKRKFNACCQEELILLEVKPEQVTLAEAVQSYLFNSQLIALEDDTMSLICASDCQNFKNTQEFLRDIEQQENPISAIHYVDVRQSMKNGGGPACLRLRIVLTAQELQHSHQPVFLDDRLYQRLTVWVENHYRDELDIKDLADPKLLQESRTALDDLTTILQLGSLYLFQRG